MMMPGVTNRTYFPEESHLDFGLARILKIKSREEESGSGQQISGGHAPKRAGDYVVSPLNCQSANSCRTTNNAFLDW
jgi:hypothetical protein